MATGVDLATAYVSLAISSNKIAPQIKKEFGQVERDADSAGKTAGKNLGDGVDKGSRSGLKAAGSQFKGFVGGVAASMAAVGIANLFSGTINAASEAQQSVGGVQSVYGKYAGQVIADSKKVDKTLGLSATQYNKLMLIAGSGMKNKGFTDYLDKSNFLLKRGADLGAVYGKTTEEAVNALNAAVNRGEYEQIEGLGITLNESAVNAELAAKGQSKLTGAALERAKAEARLAIITKQSADANGQFGRESDTYAGQQQRFTASMDNAKAAIGERLLPMMTALTGFVAATLVPAIEWAATKMGEFGGWVQANAGWLGPLAAGIGVAAGAFLVFTYGATALGAASTIAAGAVTFLGAAITFLTSPIGLALVAIAALVAGFVWLYQNNETVRVGVQAAWTAIGSFITTTWTAVIQPALAALWGFITNTVIPVIQWLWNNVVKPVFTALGAFIAFTWTNVIKPVLTALWGFISNILAPVIIWLWNNIVKPAFAGIGANISFAWNSVIKPVFDLFKGFITDILGPAVTWLWNNVVKPGFEGIGKIISGAWNTVIKPVFDFMKTAVTETLPKAFTAGTTAIGKAWDAIKGIVQKPIEFIVNTVLNDGLIAGYNKIASTFKAPEIPRIELAWLKKAEGGRIGGYSPTSRSDNIPAMLTAQEHVIRQRSAIRMRRRFPGVLEYINQHGSLPGYRGGGPVLPYQLMSEWVKKNLPGARITSGYRQGSITSTGNKSNHSMGRAVDITGANMPGYFEKIKSAFGAIINELIYSPMNGKQVKRGKSLNYGEPVRGDHWDHVHWAMSSFTEAMLGGKFDPAAITGEAAGGGGDGGGIWGFIRTKVKELLGKLPGADTTFGKMLTAVPIKLVDGLEAFLTGLWEKINPLNWGGDGGGGDAPPGSGVERWRSTVVQALKIMGQPESLADTVLRRMNQESGGNPNAQNNWDSNARAGTPSKGLLQTIDPTYRAYAHPQYNKGPLDPLSNILASMRYALARYGSLSAAYNRSGGYADGGGVFGPAGDDNVPAWLTAGEWVHPTDTVSYYGAGGMAAIQGKAIPRSVIDSFASGRANLAGAGPRKVVVQIGQREFEGYMSEVADAGLTRLAARAGVS